MVSNGGIAAVSKRTRDSVANSRYIVRISAEFSGFDSTKQEKKSQISFKTSPESSPLAGIEYKKPYSAL